MIRTACSAIILLGIGSTVASAASEIPKPEHPTPGAMRAHWANLNGPWQFRFDPKDEGRDGGWAKPDAAAFEQTITVPFGWESELSGIQKHDPKGIGWYRRTVKVPDDFPKTDRVWLHFGAVDWQADVWVNGQHVATHEGGYSPFAADITDALKPGEPAVVTVRAFDPTDPHLPTGKQVHWYTPTSGIWQTVWLESRPAAYLDKFTIQTTYDAAVFFVSMRGLPKGKSNLSVHSQDATVAAASKEISVDSASPDGGTQIELKVPVSDPKLWSPESPHLYDVTLELQTPGGSTDRVQTYFGLRTISRGKYGDEPFERILLNGLPIYIRGALDQSFNPKGIYTAPDDAFMKNDIALAKKLGLNALRIHIKPDEPRRLYWADKLGLLIMEDMPNTWEQDARAREAWEHTMREVVARDRNHPAIFAWVAFNETWGLGRPEQYKASRDTQDWVRSMVHAIKGLDPSRLVEDNSPCNYDHVETDINSWHFYIDDDAAARKHIAEVVEKTEPGSHFNYCPGIEQSTAPLMNSEYGSVSAGGGDRDISWGFRDLTTQLRKYPKIQGYIYTELTDIEWEHNGFVNYDRTPKTFGYEAFIPNMSPAEFQGADFIGYDGPPVIVAKPGQSITVPIFVSHYSDRQGSPTLRWWTTGYEESGERSAVKPRFVPIEWTSYGVKWLKPITMRAPRRPYVGALALVLEDAQGHRVASNYVNIVVKPEQPAPRLERENERRAIVRFAPGEFARQKWSGSVGNPTGKVYGHGKGFFEYRLKLPGSVAKAEPAKVELQLEVASKAARERVDWPQRVNSLDNPQTDQRRWPSTLEVTINGAKLAREALNDDPADSRGVLSHLARVDHGSYGQLMTIEADLSESVRSELAAGKPLVLRLAVPDNAKVAGGLCIFGAETGQFPFDPTLTIVTAKDMPTDLGASEDKSLAIDVAAARQKILLPAGDQPGASDALWHYTTSEPGPDWNKPDFDDKSWSEGKPGFGTSGTPAVRIGTPWETKAIWMRTRVQVPALKESDSLALHLFHDEDITVFVNGERLYQARGYLTSYRDIALGDEQKKLFKSGENVLSVTCRQTGGGQGVDVGLRLLEGE